MDADGTRTNGAAHSAQKESSTRQARRPPTAPHDDDWGPPIAAAPDVSTSANGNGNSFDTGLEVDSEVDPGNGSLDYADDDGQGHSIVGYARSTYPRVHPSHRTEYPYGNDDFDDVTIDSSRTLYSEQVDFVEENGRQYVGNYHQPVDQEEQTRQYVIHQVYLKVFDLRLTTVPLDNPRYILDIGTGVGEWAIGIAEQYPDCEVFGTDIAPIQPTQQVPFNVEFHIEDAEEEWIRPADTVDLVHIRNMAGAFSDWDFIYQQAYNCIRPGGWIEVLDFDDYHADKNFLSFYPPTSPMYIIEEGLREAAQMSGRFAGTNHMQKSCLEASGFVDVADEVFDLKIGPREDSSYGNFYLFCYVTGIEAFCLRPLTQLLGWDADYVRDLCSRAAAETRALCEDPTKEGFVVKLRALRGRKPLPSEAAAVTSQWTTAKSLNENGEITEYSGGDDSTIGSRTIKSDGTIGI
ncbi:S-adenosyl-L-methionine-dependent methyltransferase [Echria macrotheca]|uniref:S-adenosyl-L-methionine-dependent methyltransferase n=1 Tax=Echria macrotheca TaxID=438768 RepID=A0AAJ0FA72_9PEZI|nr:S-adenosyl-L-methionine-dependent methyltransferase [Echria macrotheca]